MRKKVFVLLGASLLGAAMLLPGCKKDEPFPTVSLPVTISVPVVSDATRAPGDPGQQELWEMPTHALIYTVTSPTADYRTHLVTGTHISLDETRWEYDAERSALTGGTVYTYRGPANVDINDTHAYGRVYVVLSRGQVQTIGSNPIMTEQEVRNMRFCVPAGDDVTPAQRNDFLRNLYSTPWRLNGNDGRYYATIGDMTSRVPRVDVICYHVASRLDLQWNVAPESQATKKLTYLSVNELPATGALFDPVMGNNAAEVEKYSEVLLNYTSYPSGAGTQWYGREMLYMVHNSAMTRLNLTTGYNWTSERTQNHPTVNFSSAQSQVFTPWVRCVLNVY